MGLFGYILRNILNDAVDVLLWYDNQKWRSRYLCCDLIHRAMYYLRVIPLNLFLANSSTPIDHT